MQPSEWVLLVDPVGRPGEYNMATDDALLDEVTRSGRAYLRLYRWDPPALSVGRNQQSRFDGMPVVRRPTGGQAVWHEREVTYAVAAPIAMFGSLRNAYCEIHKRLAVALRSLGVDAVLAGRQAMRPSGRPPSCFAVAVGGEILVAGKKLVGSAQVRRGDAFLQHGSILLAGAQKYVDGGSAATTLAAVLGRVPTFQEITTAIVVNWGEPLQRTGGGGARPFCPLPLHLLGHSEILSAMLRRFLLHCFVGFVVIAVAGCERRGGCTGAWCGTLINAAVAEPGTLLPPSSEDIVANDIDEQLFLKLADVGPSENTIGDEDFQPLLAQKWEWDGPLTLVFHIDPRARWQDGPRVTAADVEFTFNAYTDSAVGSPFRPKLLRIASVTQRDSLTTVFRFKERYPEMFYDAVYHMRILPAHLLRPVPRDQWRTAPFGRQPVGSGPYRFVQWLPAQSIELVADSTFFLGRPGIRRLIWRFTPNLQVAVQQVIADQADVREQLVTPDNVARARAAQQLAVYTYRGNTYTYLTFNQRSPDDTTKPHPLFADRDLRRALSMAVDRATLLKSELGDLAKVPPGPMSELLWIWDPDIRQLPYDSAQAGRRLNALGWRDHDGDGIRDKDGQPLAFHILVPTSSVLRRQYARLLQAQFSAVGVRVEIDELEPAVVGQRVSTGKYDTAILSRSNDPSPSSGIAQNWTRAAGASNFGRYYSPEFERIVDLAVTATSRDRARSLWRSAIETLNADAPAIFLYALDNAAAVHKRVENVQLRPDSWAALLRTWRIPPDRLIDRDRVER